MLAAPLAVSDNGEGTMRTVFRICSLASSLVLLSGSAVAQDASRRAPAGEIELRLGRLVPGVGYLMMKLPHDGTKLYVEQSAVTAPADIVSITKQSTESTTTLGLFLSPDADSRLRERSEQVLSTGAGYVVVFIEGKAVAAVALENPIGGTVSRQVVIAIDNSALPKGSSARILARYPAKQ